MENKEVRVRFAPSPTGPLHIGGVRTALYNYLFARHYGGKMILRIEDTDQSRFVPGAEEYINEALKWCGIDLDESSGKGGSYAPYKQSERKEIYRKYAEQLIEAGYAYYAFDTPEELEEMRNRMKAQGVSTPQYDAKVRNSMNNSINLSPDQLQKKLDSGIPNVIRILMPDNEEIHINDIIREDVYVNSSQLDDKVLFKSDGMPTYHLANVVDDHLMEITHVIRGEEWLPSAPLHVLLYKYLGWEKDIPQFAHLPLLLKPDGNGKLSKRDGDRLGFPVFPLNWTDPQSGEVSSGYREAGYFPESFINILAFLGWNPGTTQEIFSIDELIKEFSLERVGKSGSKFDPEKAKWYNHQYLVSKDIKEITSLFQEFLKTKDISYNDDYVEKVCELVRERANFIKDLWDQAYYFFQAPTSYDEKLVRKKWKEHTSGLISELLVEFEGTESFKAEDLHTIVEQFIQKKEIGMGQVMIALRLTLVGSGMGPDLFAVMDLLGKEEVMNRINTGLRNILNIGQGLKS
ncbi:MAG: glutamate--tRNA ligase [Bacteroidales bacterium]|nr:glutamate--tRNA ligase [Bacteroidales bacterium]